MNYLFYANVELSLFNNIQIFGIFIGIILIILYSLIYLNMRIRDDIIYLYSCLCIFTYILVVVYGPVYLLLNYMLVCILGSSLFVNLFTCICVIIYSVLCILYLIYSVYCYINANNMDINSINITNYNYIFMAISIICIIIAITLCIDCLSLLILTFLDLYSALPFNIFSAIAAANFFNILTNFEILFLLNISMYSWLCIISLIIAGIGSYLVKKDGSSSNLDYTDITTFYNIFAIVVVILSIVFILLAILLLLWIQ